VREGEGVAREVAAAADERDREVQARLGVAVHEEALLLAVALSKMTKRPEVFGGSDQGAPAGICTVFIRRDHWQR
jgi:hypothetical protein